MKKTILFLLCPVMLFLLCACTGNEPKGAETDGYDFSVQYIRTNGERSDTEYPATVLICSHADLEEYIRQNGDCYDLRELIPAAEKYTEEWFNGGHVLLMVLMIEPSGSIRHEVTCLTRDTVTVNRLVPESGTDDMAEWHILIEADVEWEISENFRIVVTENMP